MAERLLGNRGVNDFTRTDPREMHYSLLKKKPLRMLLGGKLTLDEIAEYTNLSLDEVKEFAAITSAAKS